MANTTWMGRIQCKNDKEANWLAVANTFVPMAGEVCITTDGANANLAKFGDGVKAWGEIPYVGADIAADLAALDDKVVDLAALVAVNEGNFDALKATVEANEETLDKLTEDFFTISGANYGSVTDVKNTDNAVEVVMETVTTTLENGYNYETQTLEVNVKVDPSKENALTKTADGLKVVIPDASEYTIAKADTTEDGYLATYTLEKDGVAVGAAINIPKDYLVKSAAIYTVETDEEPYAGATVGDKYIDFIINSSDTLGNESHIYLPVNDLVDEYVAGSAIRVTADNVISVRLTEGNGLAVVGNAIAMDKADANTDGALSKEDFAKFDAAQTNVIEAITIDGAELAINDKTVALPLATQVSTGLVKGSTGANKVKVNTDGTMEVNSLNANKIVQTAGDLIIIDCGGATEADLDLGDVDMPEITIPGEGDIEVGFGTDGEPEIEFEEIG